PTYAISQIPTATANTYDLSIDLETTLSEVHTLTFDIFCEEGTFSINSSSRLVPTQTSWFGPTGTWEGTFSLSADGRTIHVELFRTDGGLASGSGYLVTLTNIVITIDDFSKRFPDLMVRPHLQTRNVVRWEIHNQQLITYSESPIYQVEILSLQGERILSTSGSRLDLNLPPGVYLLRITYAAGVWVEQIGMRSRKNSRYKVYALYLRVTSSSHANLLYPHTRCIGDAQEVYTRRKVQVES
ncbi:MAG: T9SS type A sorting domain-containing protein, partial [Bacteroidota bacterium]